MGAEAVRPALPLIAVALLCGCVDQGDEAEKRYEMVKRTGTRGEICDTGKEVADAYLKAANEEKYRWWHLVSNNECLNAQLIGRDTSLASDQHLANAIAYDAANDADLKAE